MLYLARFHCESRIFEVDLVFHPLTPECWADFESLFGPRGACAGCWCMFWKLPNKDFSALAYDGNKSAQRALVKSGVVPGLLAYADGEAVGWIAVEPRDQYPRLTRSRVLKPVDDNPVWSITCFFTRKDFRGAGVTVALLKAAIDHVKKLGGRIVEGYPVEPKKGKMPAAFVYTGLASAFRKAGFKEVARNSETRPIFRFVIGG
ncbi:MAG: GNAT family N-acetyltransferase [Chloroflexi bacterium]|nr:GNAT family N-acetyltransferase [Chloroflexota bacterium]